MTKLTPAQEKFLNLIANLGEVYVSVQATQGYYRTANELRLKGLVARTDEHNYGDTFAITPAGLAYLYQDAPMVDQPQPAPHNHAVGETIHFMIDRELIGVITEVWAGGYHVQVEGQSFQHRIPFGCVMPKNLWEMNNLPFSDVGKEDTQEAPAVIDDTPPTLSNLIDAALDPDNQAAYAALKAYDFASTPLWTLEIERDDVNTYKWQQWHLLRKMPYGVMGSNPDYAAKQLEVDRAFNVMTILNDAIYSHHKGVGFNVLD